MILIRRIIYVYEDGKKESFKPSYLAFYSKETVEKFRNQQFKETGAKVINFIIEEQ